MSDGHHITSPTSELKFDLGGFHKLIPRRVQQILLVSSLYESFILEEEGLVGDLITSEYMDMNLSHAPRVARVSNGEQALQFIRENPVDLVITMTRLGGLNVSDFASQARESKPDLPIVVLVDDSRELLRQPALRDRSCIANVFVWHGDAKILLTIIKLIEDKLNVEHDTATGDVRVIILVENSVRFYSTYLPLIYTELVKLTQSLMAEGINLMQRLLRMRARPKILLAENFEEAWELYSKYSSYVLGVITDIRFPRDGELDSSAGLEFTRRIKERSPDTPILLQSSDGSHSESALRLQAGFVNKKSPTLLEDVRSFIVGSLGFGDFIFAQPDGTMVGRAHDLRSFEDMVKKAPDDCLTFHALHNHFSNWFMARTEFDLARRIRPKKVTDFSAVAEMRRYLLEQLSEFRRSSHTGVIADFSRSKFDVATSFTRIGGGSMGGKARGLAFINVLIRRAELQERYPNVRIAVPNSAALGTGVFDSFMDKNRLWGLVSNDLDNSEVAEAFRRVKIPKTVHKKLSAFLQKVRYPLAVRSSSLLEDSPEQPFAGVYTTHMLPNNHPNPKVRLEQLCDAIKLVYASTFYRAARHYLEATSHHAQEEKMGVILQELVGSPHGGRYYPTFSGVARSYNYYPAAKMVPEDGVAYVALGLGKMVVEGGEVLMFSPAHPKVLPQFATIKDMLRISQRRFYALDISRPEIYPTPTAEANLLELDLEAAEGDGTLAPIGSVYSPENDSVSDGLSRSGTRLVTFAHVLKANLFPLAQILKELLEIGQDGMGCPVEIEFAVDMTPTPMQFGFLQIRPAASDEEHIPIDMDSIDASEAVCFSPQVLGNGRLCGIQDIIYVMPDVFDSAYTREMAQDIAVINDKLRHAGRQCIIIGPGRWGSLDRWLGIPVTWDQISTAQVIVETALKDFMVAPSQGTHFFQNLTSNRVGYFTVNPPNGQGRIDWPWLAAQPAVQEGRFLRHLLLREPVEVLLDGKSRRGVILKRPCSEHAAI